jgi:alkylresorcinol/alkylpyrone synthase
MPSIVATATTVPEHRISQHQARDFAAGIFSSHFADIDRLLPLFSNAGIESRYFAMPLDWFDQDHSFEEKNDLYVHHATDLSERVSRAVLDRAGVASEALDAIFYVSTTGLATPSIDARLINLLNLRKDIQRTPIWGLGCAGGAAGLARIHHYLLGHPDQTVLLVATELCGLTFMRDDFSKSNLVACALFAEGAAAALVAGDEVGADGLDILATQSQVYPDSLDIMGWNIQTKGLQVVFDRRIPQIVAENSAAELEVLLKQNSVDKDAVAEYLYHPGGAKVLDAYEEAYGIDNGALDRSRRVLLNYGNMSSATVLFVLDDYLSERSGRQDGFGVISALGPGFSSESLLVKL